MRVYDFKYYLKNVLPNEWGPSWHTNSLKAEAVAVENYGWYWVNNWRGGTAPSGECYDVDDSTSYQVFRPGTQYAGTDAAVDVAWKFATRKSGAVFEGRYWSGNQGEGCGVGADGAQMRQEGTKTCADGGMDWRQIVTTYYYPGVTFAGITRCDYNGDGKSEIATWRPADGTWRVKDQFNVQWGWSNDVPVPGDYNGDGKTDVATWRPADGTWRVKDQFDVQWGWSNDVPVPGDYNGDGKTDIAAWRPADGTWRVKDQFNVQWGWSNDVPVPADYNGDGKTDIAAWRPSDGIWRVKDQFDVAWGIPNLDLTADNDFNGDGKADLAVWRPSDGIWRVREQFNVQWGWSEDIHLAGRRCS